MEKNCEKFERLISDRLDGEISPADESALESHLARCENCRSYEASAILLRERLRSLPDLADESEVSLSEKGIERRKRLWSRRISLPLPLAAALAALMLAGWLLALGPGDVRPAPPAKRSVLVQSVEIIRAEPAQAAPAGAGTIDSVHQKEGEI